MEGDHVEAHDQEVVLLPGKVAHMVAHQTFRNEAQPFEGRDRALLIRRHPGHELLDPRCNCRLEGLLHQQPAQALAASNLGNHAPDLGHV